MPCASFPMRPKYHPADTVRSHFEQFGELLDVVRRGRREGEGEEGGRPRRVAGACAAATEDPRPPLPSRPSCATASPANPAASASSLSNPRTRRTPRQRNRTGSTATGCGEAGGVGGRGVGVARMRGARAARPGVSGGPLQPPKRHKQTNKKPHRFQIDAKRSVPHDARPRSKKVFVGGLAPDTGTGESRGRGAGPREGGARAAADPRPAPLRPSPDEFTSYFGQFGVVTDAQIMVDHSTGRSRGFG